MMIRVMRSERLTMATLAAAAALSALSTAAIGQCPPKYEVTAVIPPPSCGPFGTAGVTYSAMNAGGQATGYLTCSGSSFISFVWSEKMGFKTLPPPQGIGSSQVYDINNVYGMNAMGQMTGEMTPSGMPMRAFLLDNGEWSNLGLLPESTQSFGFSINDSTTIVGLSTNNVTGPLQAFKWTDGVMTALSGLDGPNSSAVAINAVGQITGWMGDGQITDAVAFIWHNGTVTALPPVPGGTTSQGRAINVHGDIAGRGKYFDREWNANVWRGYAYIKGTAVRIDPLPGFKDVSPQDINASRQIVGFCQTAGSRPFVWEKGHIYDLNDLVPPGTPTLTITRAIDDEGHIIASNSASGPNVGLLLSPLPRKPGDLTCDGSVGVPDLLVLLGAWGPCPNVVTCHVDINDDGTVGVADLLILLSNWGS